MTEAAHDDGASGTVALGGTPWRGTDVAEAQRVTLGELGADHWPVLPEPVSYTHLTLPTICSV